MLYRKDYKLGVPPKGGESIVVSEKDKADALKKGYVTYKELRYPKKAEVKKPEIKKAKKKKG